MAISNRYGRYSIISVINDEDWTARTYKIIDASEPGLTLINSWIISTPIEVTTSLNDFKNLESQLLSMANHSFIDTGIASVSPRSGAMAAKSAKREYSVQILIQYANSVTDMWDIGNYTLTQAYIRGQLIYEVMYHSAFSLIMQKIKPFTVTAIFDDRALLKWFQN